MYEKIIQKGLFKGVFFRTVTVNHFRTENSIGFRHESFTEKYCTSLYEKFFSNQLVLSYLFFDTVLCNAFRTENSLGFRQESFTEKYCKALYEKFLRKLAF